MSSLEDISSSKSASESASTSSSSPKSKSSSSPKSKSSSVSPSVSKSLSPSASKSSSVPKSISESASISASTSPSASASTSSPNSSSSLIDLSKGILLWAESASPTPGVEGRPFEAQSSSSSLTLLCPSISQPTCLGSRPLFIPFEAQSLSQSQDSESQQQLSLSWSSHLGAFSPKGVVFLSTPLVFEPAYSGLAVAFVIHSSPFFPVSASGCLPSNFTTSFLRLAPISVPSFISIDTLYIIWR